MSRARTSLLERLKSFESALKSPALVTTSLEVNEQNLAAKVFRNGLSVIGFAILEDFIKNRTAEVMSRVGDGSTPFHELPEALQRAALIEAIESLKFQTKINRTSGLDLVKEYQELSVLMASTANPRYNLPNKVFGFSKSNINEELIQDILTAFFCNDGWSIMGGVSRRCGTGVIDLKSAFRNAAERRHSAAHDASASIEISTLVSFLPEIIAICLSFDLTISKSLRKILDRDFDTVVNKRPVANSSISIRFIQEVGGKFKELDPNRARAISVSASLTDALTKTIPNAQRHGAAIIVKDERGFPIQWSTPYVD